MFTNINIWAVLVAAISAFGLGGIWYSRLLFGKIWSDEAGVVCDPEKKGHNRMVFVVAFIFSLIAAFAFAKFLGAKPALNFAVLWGFIVGACWVTTSFGINYLFAQRTIKLFLIDGGYHIIQFVLYGIVLGLWH